MNDWFQNDRPLCNMYKETTVVIPQRCTHFHPWALPPPPPPLPTTLVVKSGERDGHIETEMVRWGICVEWEVYQDMWWGKEIFIESKPMISFEYTHFPQQMSVLPSPNHPGGEERGAWRVRRNRDDTTRRMRGMRCIRG